MAHTVGDVIRMAGHLVLHRGVHVRGAVDETGSSVHADDISACRWCVYSALTVCAEKLGCGFALCRSVLMNMFHTDTVALICLWDHTTDEGRASIARQMIAYQDPVVAAA